MKLQSITSGLVMLMFLLGMTISFAQNSTEEISDQIYKDYKKEGIDTALKKFDKSPVKGDEYTVYSEPLNILGYRLMDIGDLEAAEKVFLAQIDEYPNEANPYDSYADLLLEKGDEEKAKKYFQKAIDLSATIDDSDLKERSLAASKTKLAKIEGRGKDLKFLEGKWEMKNFAIEDGEKNLQNEGNIEFSLNQDSTVLTGIFKSKSGEFLGTRIIAYDAIDEVYDMVWIGNNMRGINPSTIKIKKSSPEEVIMVQKYKEDGNDVKVRHILKKTSEKIAWDVHDLSRGADENLVSQMTFTKTE